MKREFSTNLARATLTGTKPLARKKPFSKKPISEVSPKKRGKDPIFLRSNKEAWDLVTKTESERNLIHAGIRFWKLDSRIPYEDAYQLGILSVFNSALRWEPQKNDDFFSYALSQMQSCWREVGYLGETAHIPAYMREAKTRMNKWLAANPQKTKEDFFESKNFSKFAKRNGCKPETISKNLGLVGPDSRPVDGHAAFNSAAPQSKEEHFAHAEIIVGMSEYCSKVANTGGILFQEEVVIANTISAALKDAFKALDTRSRKILSRRHGLNGYKRKHKWEEIGKAYNITKQAAEQRGAKAIKALGANACLFEVWEEL